MCSTQTELCAWVKQRFRDNRRFVEDTAATEMERDPFWYQVHLFYQQMGSEEAAIDVMTRHVQRVNSIYREIGELKKNLAKKKIPLDLWGTRSNFWFSMIY